MRVCLLVATPYSYKKYSITACIYYLVVIIMFCFRYIVLKIYFVYISVFECSQRPFYNIIYYIYIFNSHVLMCTYIYVHFYGQFVHVWWLKLKLLNITTIIIYSSIPSLHIGVLYYAQVILISTNSNLTFLYYTLCLESVRVAFFSNRYNYV